MKKEQRVGTRLPSELVREWKLAEGEFVGAVKTKKARIQLHGTYVTMVMTMIQ